MVIGVEVTVWGVVVVVVVVTDVVTVTVVALVGVSHTKGAGVLGKITPV